MDTASPTVASDADAAALVRVVRQRGARLPTHGRSTMAPLDASARRFGSARPVQHALRVRRRRGADRDQRRPGERPTRLVHTIRAVGRVDASARPSQAAATCSACAARSAAAGRSTTAEGRTSWWSPAASASRRCGRRSTTCSPSASAIGRVALLYGAAQPGRHPLPRRARALARRLDFEVEVTVDRAGTDWHGHVGVVTTLIPRAAFDPAHDRGPGLRAGGDDALRRARAERRGRGRRARSTSRSSAT